MCRLCNPCSGVQIVERVTNPPTITWPVNSLRIAQLNVLSDNWSMDFREVVKVQQTKHSMIGLGIILIASISCFHRRRVTLHKCIVCYVSIPGEPMMTGSKVTNVYTDEGWHDAGKLMKIQKGSYREMLNHHFYVKGILKMLWLISPHNIYSTTVYFPLI